MEQTTPRRLVIAALLVAATLASFRPVTGNDFIIGDDDYYVTRNPAVLGGLTAEGVKRAFTTVTACNWHPLTMLSHMLDAELFGRRPGGHHLTSLLWHAAAAAVLFLLLASMTGATWASAFTAALFALHPLHVESVAWVAERKDVLSASFWFLALWAYVAWARRPRRGRYAAVAVLFLLALAAKPMPVTLPFVLLVLDWWPLGRWSGEKPGKTGLVAEKLPLFAVSAAWGVLTYAVQQRCGAVAGLAEVPLSRRLAGALAAGASYLAKAVRPLELSAYYPWPAAGLPAWQVTASLGLLVFLFAAAWLARRRLPFLGAGLLWYLVTLSPVIGLVRVGDHLMADRYTYVPLVGPFVALAWGARHLARRKGLGPALLLASALAALLPLSVLTFRRTLVWRDTLALYGQAAEVTADNWFALSNIGAAHYAAGRNDLAAEHFARVVRLRPGIASAWHDLGSAYRRLGRTAEAEAAFRRALDLKPDFPEALYQLGVILYESDRLEEAAAAFERAAELAPGDQRTLTNLGITLKRLGRLDPHRARELRRAMQPGR